MTNNILITGASGYLGGTLLARWAEANMSGYDALFALVRKPEQADAVRKLYNATPLQVSLEDEQAVRDVILSNKINIVLFQIDAYYLYSQLALIKALSALKKETGQDVHFIYVSGTKQFSSHGGAPNDKPLSDADPDLYEIHKAQVAPVKEMQAAIDTNCQVIELCEEHNVNVYIFSPCIVYGQGEGFGNVVSIQTVDVVNAALSAKAVYNPGTGSEMWPVCHVVDTVYYIIRILQALLAGKSIDSGKRGFYLASSGRMAWKDIYQGVAQALTKRGLIEDETVHPMTEEARQLMATGLGVAPEGVELKIGGNSTYKADNGSAVGWTARYPPEHILEVIDDEVEAILDNLGKTKVGHR